jgi:hypothetical protein
VKSPGHLGQTCIILSISVAVPLPDASATHSQASVPLYNHLRSLGGKAENQLLVRRTCLL